MSSKSNFTLGYEIARKKQNGDEDKSCCCFRTQVAEQVTTSAIEVEDSDRAKKADNFFKGNRKKSPYGLEEFEKDLKMRRLKNRQ